MYIFLQETSHDIFGEFNSTGFSGCRNGAGFGLHWGIGTGMELVAQGSTTDDCAVVNFAPARSWMKAALRDLDDLLNLLTILDVF